MVCEVQPAIQLEDNEDEGALPPAVCSRCTIADNTPIPKPFEEALKKINLEV